MTDPKDFLEKRVEQEQADALAEAFSGADAAERRRLARIMDLLPCYVALIDKSHQILFHNKAFEEYFGPPDSNPCYKAMRSQENPCTFCPPLTLLGGSRSNVMEWVHPGSNNAFRVHSYLFDEGVRDAYVLQVGFNITANVRVQQALDLSEQSYRAITDNLSIGVALLDPNLRIKAGNIRLSQWFAEGFRLDRKICNLLHCWGNAPVSPDEHGVYNCVDCPFLASLQDGNTHEKELTVVFQDGGERHVRLVSCPVRSGKQPLRKHRVRALIMMLEDITTRLRVNQQLQRARKIEAMSTLAGGIAHEINQPLSALHLYASGLQMLLEKHQELPSETTQERLSLILHEAEKIRGIISHMRALVMQEGKVPLRGVSLERSVRSTLTIMQSQLESNQVSVSVDIPENIPLVRSNALQLEQVLVNLVANAIHAMDSKRIFHIRKSGEPAIIARKLLIRAYQNEDGQRIRLEVADSGPGLPKGSERIFDPFYTTKERHQGMGLGLSIVHGLVSLWGGEISALPRHPQLGGAAFFVDMLPAGPEELGAGQERTLLSSPLEVANEEDVLTLDENAMLLIRGGENDDADEPDEGEGDEALDDFETAVTETSHDAA